jgi:hypothetical protein
MVKARFIFSVSLVILLLFSCSRYSQNIQALYTHYYNVDELNNRQNKRRSMYIFYDESGELIFQKSIIQDSTYKSISLDSGYKESLFNTFDISWKKIPPSDQAVHKQSSAARRPGDPPEPVYLNEVEKSKHNDESLDVDYYFSDTAKKVMVELNYQDFCGKISESEIMISHYSDTLEYYRTLEVSPEVAEYFRSCAFNYTDSIEFTKYPPLPNLRSCRLIESRYTLTNDVSSKSGNKREIIIDSTLIDGSYEVNQSDYYYFLYREKNPSGNRTFKEFTSRYYREFHYLPNEVNPYYAFEYSLALNETDTTFKYEMTTLSGRRLNRYKYIVFEYPSKNTNNIDLRLPIMRREIYFWVDPRKQSIVRKRYLAFTSEGHRLEFDWLNEGYETKTDIRTIPEISGDVEYDLIPKRPRKPMYPFYNSMSNRKPESNQGQTRNKTNKIVKHIRKQSVKLEKDRQSGFEKRIAEDSTKIYEFIYLKKQ